MHSKLKFAQFDAVLSSEQNQEIVEYVCMYVCMYCRVCMYVCMYVCM